MRSVRFFAFLSKFVSFMRLLWSSWWNLRFLCVFVDNNFGKIWKNWYAIKHDEVWVQWFIFPFCKNQVLNLIELTNSFIFKNFEKIFLVNKNIEQSIGSFWSGLKNERNSCLIILVPTNPLVCFGFVSLWCNARIVIKAWPRHTMHLAKTQRKANRSQAMDSNSNSSTKLKLPSVDIYLYRAGHSVEPKQTNPLGQPNKPKEL